MRGKLESVYTEFYDARIKGKDLGAVERLRVVHEYLQETVNILPTDDENDTPHARDVVGALVTCRCTSNGLAAAFKYLCDRVGGVETIIVEGSARGVPHAWNAARINGEFYHIDATKEKAEMTPEDHIQFLAPG